MRLFLKPELPVRNWIFNGLSRDPRDKQKKRRRIIDTLCAEPFQRPILPVEIGGIFTSGATKRRNTSLGRNPSNNSVGFSVKKGSI